MVAKTKSASKRDKSICLHDGGTCGIGGYCANCPHMPSKSTSKRLAHQRPVMQKTKAIRSQKLRDSAHMEECTFQIPGVCNHDPATTVLCHLPDESHGGSRKSDDHCSAYGCSSCHDVIDGRNGVEIIGDMLHDRNKGEFAGIWCDREWYLRRAMVRTWRRMIEKGLVKIDGYKPD